MMVCQRTRGMFVCCIQVGAFGTCYFFKYRVLYCCTTNQCHIIRASIMIITVQTVWIGKVCVHTAKAIGSFIHKVCKSRNTARYKFLFSFAEQMHNNVKIVSVLNRQHACFG